MIHILLFQPEIPPNTGNVIRLAANTGCQLHLVEPLGFSMEEKGLRRAGLDYHEFAKVQIWPDFEQFKKEGHPAHNRAALSRDPQAHRVVFDEIRASQANHQSAGRPQAIHAIHLLAEPFTPGEELTNLFKLKRHVIETKYRAELATLFAGAPGHRRSHQERA